VIIIKFSDYGNPLLNNDNINLTIQNSNFSNVNYMACILIEIQFMDIMNYTITFSNNFLNDNFNII
jgi:hypothetical protein